MKEWKKQTKEVREGGTEREEWNDRVMFKEVLERKRKGKDLRTG